MRTPFGMLAAVDPTPAWSIAVCCETVDTLRGNAYPNVHTH
ncbi:hypothetical protein [Parapedobacter sp. 10938]|nr:hypothetical protein [Parapedobacter sp. 10938]MEC3878710.1 hypothetical protein [Parapedobacter sp. 10938]